MRPDSNAPTNPGLAFPAKTIFRVAAAVLLLVLVCQAQAAPAPQNSPPSAAGPVYDSEAFVQELARLKAGLAAAGESTEALREYRESLPKTWSVDTGGGRYEVRTDLLASRLLKAEKQPGDRAEQLGQAREYLDALASEAGSVAAHAPASDASSRAKLDAILARPEYARARQQSWWDKLRARVDKFLLDALVSILSRVGGQRSLGYALLWIAICVTAVLIAYGIFRRWFRAAGAEEMALQAAAVPLRSRQEWIFGAREAAGRGDYRTAIHCAYWAGIARLQDAGALPADRAKTPREYLGALSGSKLVLPESLSTRQAALSRLTSRLEKNWYGYYNATEADYRDSLAQLENLGCHLP